MKHREWLSTMQEFCMVVTANGGIGQRQPEGSLFLYPGGAGDTLSHYVANLLFLHVIDHGAPASIY
jgi:hypothetical protein